MPSHQDSCQPQSSKTLNPQLVTELLQSLVALFSQPSVGEAPKGAAVGCRYGDLVARKWLGLPRGRYATDWKQSTETRDPSRGPLLCVLSGDQVGDQVLTAAWIAQSAPSRQAPHWCQHGSTGPKLLWSPLGMQDRNKVRPL
ncbi:hypothetical protein SKAU_G00398030 [Synaphobranchus kaupii]|uniref:Uncharacterized protein n=1 Tax=Synaphobranchus kaupii TaxID=118154 RepID=A0A9Q1E8H7_SYNKA|nr:hypothetical protein SKAU_G00398030 [Synaphobranchus kaupii]